MRVDSTCQHQSTGQERRGQKQSQPAMINKNDEVEASARERSIQTRSCTFIILQHVPSSHLCPLLLDNIRIVHSNEAHMLYECTCIGIYGEPASLSMCLSAFYTHDPRMSARTHRRHSVVARASHFAISAQRLW